MTKTISFVASEELAEWLEEEAEKRMTTVSTTAQMLLAERYQEMAEPDVPENREERLDTRREEIVDLEDPQADVWRLEFEKQDFATRFREAVGEELLAGSDDKRKKVVHVEVGERSGEGVMDLATHAYSDDAMEVVTTD
jgi:hypothetical protein